MPPKARKTGNMDRMLGGIAEAPPTKPAGMTMVNPPVAWIVPNPRQPRKVFDEAEMEDLRVSIETHGLRQPVGVQQQEDGRYLLVFGERRWRAFQMLGRETIPAVLLDPSVHPEEAALIENMVRKDLGAFEEADAVGALYDRYKGQKTYEEIGRIVGRSRSAIDRLMKIRQICEQVRAEYAEHKPPMSVLNEIAALSDPDEQVGAWENYKATKRGERLPVPGEDGGPEDEPATTQSERKPRPTLAYNSALPQAVARRIYSSVKHIADLRKDARIVDALKEDDLKALETMHAEIGAILEMARRSVVASD